MDPDLVDLFHRATAALAECADDDAYPHAALSATGALSGKALHRGMGGDEVAAGAYPRLSEIASAVADAADGWHGDPERGRHRLGRELRRLVKLMRDAKVPSEAECEVFA